MKLQPGTPEAGGMSKQRVEHFINLAREWIDQGKHDTLVIFVARRGLIVAHEAFGRFSSHPNSPPLVHDALFPLASIAKPLTATAAIMLVEDGRLSLNRPIAEYIPEFVGEGKERIMVHHLLTHTAGMRDIDVNEHAEKKKGTVDIPPCDGTQYPTLHERLFLGYDAPIWKSTDQEMRYFNYGYELLAEIVRRVSGQSFSGFMTERLFEPLGMTNSHHIVPESDIHRVAGHGPEGVSELRERMDNPRMIGSGGAYSSAMDMAVFGQMFLNGGSYGDTRVLSPATVAAMTRNQIPGIGSHYGSEFFAEADWGLGWNIKGNEKSVAWGEPLQSPEVFSHGGGSGVFLWADPPYELVGAYFAIARERLPRCYDYAGLFINAVMAAVIEV